MTAKIKTRARSRRRPKRAKNFGEGNLFNFHGAYVQKVDALAKEATIPGAFIKPAWYKHGMRFAVLTKKNPPDQIHGHEGWKLVMARKLADKYVGLRRSGMTHDQAMKEVLNNTSAGPGSIALFRKMFREGYQGNPRRRNLEFGTYENGVFHPWTRRPKTRKKKAVRRLKVRKNAELVPYTIVFKHAGKFQKWERFAKTATQATQSAREALAREYPAGSYSLISVKPGKANPRRRRRKNVIAWGQGDQDYMRKALRELYPGKKLEEVIKDPQRFSKITRRADELKQAAKKQNPVIKVPGGWRGRSAKGRLSPVFTDRRDAELFAESLANPKRRRNYFEERIGEGSRVSVITANEASGPFSIRLYVNKGETATTATGKAKTLAGARKIAQKLLDRHIRGNPRRRNYENATDLYKKFHGRGPKNVTDTGIPIADYGDHPELGQLGKLVSLTFGDKEAEKPWNKKLIWGSKEAPDLAAEPGGRQLYIIGGGQDINGSLAGLPIDTDKDMLDLGFAYQVEYFSQKSFDNFQPVTYYHDLGEETGECPRLVYDRVKKRLHIVGGAYEVKPEGIVN